MILYKYVTFDTGQAIVRGNTVRFTRPKYFNDPFELSAAFDAPTSVQDGENLWEKIKIAGKNIGRKFKELMTATSYGILSLTRSPLNSLMWAHYSDDHKGFVIGINVDNDVFTSPQMNRVPVQYGSIIYTDSKPSAEILSESVATEKAAGGHAFDSTRLEHFQRLFLHKPMYWGYEEEVRIVKYVLKAGTSDYKSGDFLVTKIDGKKAYLLKLPSGSIEEIYFGLRNPLLKRSDDRESFKKEARQHGSNDLRFYKCSMGTDTWALEKTEI